MGSANGGARKTCTSMDDQTVLIQIDVQKGSYPTGELAAMPPPARPLCPRALPCALWSTMSHRGRTASPPNITAIIDPPQTFRSVPAVLVAGAFHAAGYARAIPRFLGSSAAGVYRRHLRLHIHERLAARRVMTTLAASGDKVPDDLGTGGTARHDVAARVGNEDGRSPRNGSPQCCRIASVCC